MRKKAGISQEELGFQIGVSRQTVSKWELDNVKPTTENINRLCEYFNVSADYFFNDDDTQNYPLALVQAEPAEETAITIVSTEFAVNTGVCIIDVPEEFKSAKKPKGVLWIVATIISAFFGIMGLICGSIFVYLHFELSDGDDFVRTYDFDIIGIVIISLALLFIIAVVVLLVYRFKIKNFNLTKKLSALILAVALVASTAIALGVGFVPVTAKAETASSYILEYKYLEISVSEKVGKQWKFNITNPNPYEIDVYYNTKMCNSGDAKEWEGLKDVAKITLQAYGTTNVIVLTNGTAKHFGFSYINKEVNKRLINYPQASGSSIIHKYADLDYFSDCIQIDIIGAGWIVNFTNPTDRTVTIEYNKKMCNRTDAYKWGSSLQDIEIYVLGAGKTYQVTIPKNGTATGIAVSYGYGVNRYITVAYNIRPPYSTSFKTLIIPYVDNSK